MPDGKTSKLAAVGAGLAALVAAAVGVAWLLTPATPGAGPVPVIWDKTACAHCRMHIGEPAFAAQLQTEDGRVLDFDDPGCLFELVDKQQPAIRAAYFRHVDEDRWLPRDGAGFVERSPTPMGYGLGAVDADTPGAIGFSEALERVRSRRQAVNGGAR